jgi:pimeloyl-ACP methyl ester carboxylesterase
MHSSTGSALNWGYQQPALARAGYRVIAYSQRGHHLSDPIDPNNPGTGSQDLHDFLHLLGIGRCHLVATAAGGFIAMDFAVSHQDQLLSLAVGNSLSGISDPDFNNITGLLLPSAFLTAPADFRELGASYRAAYRPGVARWLDLVSQAGSGSQPLANDISWAAIEALRVRALLFTGEADLYMPPARLRELASHFYGSETAVFGEAGHTSYWEQYAVFNRELLRFLGGSDERPGHGR